MRHNSRAWFFSWIACCGLTGLPAAFAQGYSTTVPPGTSLTNPACYTTITTAVSQDTVQESIHIQSAADIGFVRSQVATQIWGTSGLPTWTVPASGIVQTTSGNAATNASGLYPFISGPNSYLDSEWRLTVTLPSPPNVTINSIVYEWIPKASNGRLFIVHDGHSDDSYDQTDGAILIKGMVNTANQVTVSTLLQAGYTVLWLQMPLYGDNLDSSAGVSFPNCPTSGAYTINLSNCDRHGGIFASYSNPWRYFIEPVVVAINTALARGTFTDITMMGASGGGWTTVLAAAVDPRIASSASVAGSLPLFLPDSSDTCNTWKRDAEQAGAPGALYANISYLDLYILAANGTAPNGVQRRHMQINNQFDACCFYGINFLNYVPYLSSYISTNNLGHYKYYLDTTFVGHGYDIGVVKGGALVNPRCVVVNNTDCAMNNTLNVVRQIPQVTGAILSSLLGN